MIKKQKKNGNAKTNDHRNLEKWHNFYLRCEK